MIDTHVLFWGDYFIGIAEIEFFPIYSYSLKYPVGFDLSIYLCQYHTIVTLSFNWFACISTVRILTILVCTCMYWPLIILCLILNHTLNYQLLCRKMRFKTLFLIPLFTPEKKMFKSVYILHFGYHLQNHWAISSQTLDEA